MTTGFALHRRSRLIIANFSAFEADLLRSLAGQLVELLRNEQALPTEPQDPLEAMFNSGEFNFTGPQTAPDDPVLARLLPTAYPDDPDAAADFRRFTEVSLRDSKASAAETVISTLAEAGLPAVGDEQPSDAALMFDVELDLPTAMMWLKSFTDMRLALATRLEVQEGDEEFWASLAEDDPRVHAYEIYQWLGYLQETLVEALSR
jgi:hypothetical protein